MKNLRIAFQMSSCRVRMLLPIGAPLRSTSAHNIFISVSEVRGGPGTVST